MDKTTLALMGLTILKYAYEGVSEAVQVIDEMAAKLKLNGSVTDAELREAFAASAKAHADFQGA